MLFVVMVLVFISARALPGDYALQQLSQSPFAPKDLEELRRQLGYDRPLHEQFISWMGDVLTLDFGRSYQSDNSVLSEIGKRLPVTFEVGLLSMIVAALIALPIGIISAIRQDSWMDYLGRGVSIGGLAIPDFWLATIFLLVPAVWWNWSPPIQYEGLFDDPVNNLKMVALPVLIGGIGLGAVLMRMLRSQLLEVLRQDYVRTAWAKGFRERQVVFGHALKNAFIPILTLFGIVAVGRLISGSVILETIFALPGLGQYTFRALSARDYPVVQGVVLFIAAAMVFMNLLVDLLYGWFDPRIKYR